MKKTLTFKRPLVAMLLIAVTFSVMPSLGAAQSTGNPNIIVFEAEDAPASGSWRQQSSRPGASGDGYLKWQGQNQYRSPGSGVLAYTFTVENPGTYYFNLRGRRDKDGRNVASDLENDVWVRANDGGWSKVFQSGAFGQWQWGKTFDRNHAKSRAKFNFGPGEHTIYISGRSSNYQIDRFALFRDGESEQVAQNTRANQSNPGAAEKAAAVAAEPTQRVTPAFGGGQFIPSPTGGTTGTQSPVNEGATGGLTDGSLGPVDYGSILASMREQVASIRAMLGTMNIPEEQKSQFMESLDRVAAFYSSVTPQDIGTITSTAQEQQATDGSTNTPRNQALDLQAPQQDSTATGGAPTGSGGGTAAGTPASVTEFPPEFDDPETAKEYLLSLEPEQVDEKFSYFGIVSNINGIVVRAGSYEDEDNEFIDKKFSIVVTTDAGERMVLDVSPDDSPIRLRAQLTYTFDGSVVYNDGGRVTPGEIRDSWQTDTDGFGGLLGTDDIVLADEIHQFLYENETHYRTSSAAAAIIGNRNCHSPEDKVKLGKVLDVLLTDFNLTAPAGEILTLVSGTRLIQSDEISGCRIDPTNFFSSVN